MAQSPVSDRTPNMLPPLARDVSEFLQTRSALHYTFCLLICLNQSKSAKELFARVIKSGIDDLKSYKNSEEIWFFKHLHHVWKGFVRFRKELKSNRGKGQFDWVRIQDRQQYMALALMSPDEREIFLYRIWLKFGVDRIKQITDFEAKRIIDLFESAVSKVV